MSGCFAADDILSYRCQDEFVKWDRGSRNDIFTVIARFYFGGVSYGE